MSGEAQSEVVAAPGPALALPRAGAALLVLVALFPLLFSLPTLGDRYVTTEDALNASIWGLGARNLLEHGFGGAVRGALVSPDPGTLGNGIYAHHPPLSIWLMVVPVALGGWEGAARLIALLCAAATLALLARVLRRFFSPSVTLFSVGAVAASGFLLHHGRMLTTLTVAAPLFVALLDAALSWKETGRVPRWATPVAALLLLSSWDGFVGAAALGVFVLVNARGRALRPLLPPLIAGAAAAAFSIWHLVDATGGTRELLWQASWRSAQPVGLGEWALGQLWNLEQQLGPLTLLILALAPLLVRRGAPKGAAAVLAVSAAPGLLMLLLFRQGAHIHPFWGYQLIIPSAFALALVLSRAPATVRPVLIVGLALQAGGLMASSWSALQSEHVSSSSAQLLTKHFKGAERVPLFTYGRFHPWVPWNVPDARPVPEKTVADLEKHGVAADALVLADARHAEKSGCQPLPDAPRSADGRWVVMPLSVLAERCATPGR